MRSEGDFYAGLPIFDGFANIMDPARYQPLPDDWLIGLTDVVSSTQAIAEGRYKSVNTAGASVIAAVSNALEGRTFPYVFGGDGASFAVARRDSEVARDALAATAAWTRDDLQLDLRVALVPVSAVRAKGLNVAVARFGPSKDVSFAMFSGGGLAWAERAMKAGEFAIPPAPKGTRPDLSGLSCRWNDIPATRGLILSLVVAPVTHGDPAFRTLVEGLLAELESSPEVARPVPDGAPNVGWPPRGLDLEAYASRRHGQSFSARRWKLLLDTMIAYIVLKFGIRLPGFDPAVYRKQVVGNSDFRKFDDNLRMTLDCTAALADRVEKRLLDARAARIARFGLHRQPAAIMTCIVPSISDSNHVHFVDGAAGGYALAAKQMKEAG